MKMQENDELDNGQTDEANFTVSSETDDAFRHMRPSILNKSSMHSVLFCGRMLDEIPDVPANTQKLDLSRNLITKFPLHLLHLKELKLNQNLIERIPDQINDIASLTILRLSDNRITTLPFLKYVRHLELNNNPIKVMTTRLAETHLQYLSFDWIPFLFDTTFEESQKETIFNLCELITAAQDDQFKEFIEFHDLFIHRKVTHSIVYCLHKAINKRCHFFLSYLRDYHPHINFNELIFLDIPLVQEALEENYPEALEVFMLRKANLNPKPVYMVNILLACKYANLEFFNFVVGCKRSLLIENQDEVIWMIFKHFALIGASAVILQKVLKLCNYTPENPKKFSLPQPYNIVFCDAIADGILFTLLHPDLSQLIDFSSAACDLSSEPLLHFAIAARRPQLVKELLSRFHCIFTRNQNGKLPRAIRGSAISRKLIWKRQKCYIGERISLEPEEQSQLQSQQKENEQWMKMIFTPRKANPPIASKPLAEIDLIGPKVQQLQRKIQERSKLHILGRGRKKQDSPRDYERLAHEDNSGVLADFSLNYGDSSIFEGHLEQQENQLSAYEIFQKNALRTIRHDYTIKKKKQISFLASPLKFCQDVENLQQQNEKQCIVLGHKHHSHRRGSIPKQNNSGSPRISWPGSPQAALV